MRTKHDRLLLACTLLVIAAGSSAAQQAPAIRVRVMPPEHARLLQGQRFDLRVEATARDSGSSVSELHVSLDGHDISSLGSVQSTSGGVRTWMLRDSFFAAGGIRTLAASAAGKSGVATIEGKSERTVEVLAWKGAERLRPVRKQAQEEGDLDGLAGIVATGTAPDALLNGAERPRAKNVILFIGDGMGVAQRTAARVLSKGYTAGKANGTLAMDQLPFNGLLMTSSLDSLITDSAAGAHVFATGNKTNNGMEGVFPDNTEADDDNPRVENVTEWLTRNLGKVTGVVSDATITDATPAAMLAHSQNRGNGTLIASQYFDLAGRTNLKVLMGGGAYHFIPRSQPGSQRTDDRNVIRDFTRAGFRFIDTRTQLKAIDPARDTKLLALFTMGNMNVAFDKLKLGDPSIVAAYPDQPFLEEMTSKAIAILERYPDGFFLMVEGAHIDKQAHVMDAERSLYDVIQLDRAVAVALEFANRTNRDGDPSNDTLVIVTADHETSGMALPGVSRPDRQGGRDYLKTYGYGGPRNDPTIFNFTNYTDADSDGYPDVPDPTKKLIVAFGANSDRYEDWHSNRYPKGPTAIVGGIAVANPDDPDRFALGGFKVTGVLENGESGASPAGSAVHTMVDVPVSALGPGASQFARISDNTDVFFYIVNAVVGQYPVPAQF
ncbi:MAG: alkaline phosphatase [Thermoanaerobaculia bacterium]|jgi:alkaline phosphatase